jgi:hypothetical protein
MPDVNVGRGARSVRAPSELDVVSAQLPVRPCERAQLREGTGEEAVGPAYPFAGSRM